MVGLPAHNAHTATDLRRTTWWPRFGQKDGVSGRLCPFVGRFCCLQRVAWPIDRWSHKSRKLEPRVAETLQILCYRKACSPRTAGTAPPQEVASAFPWLIFPSFWLIFKQAEWLVLNVALRDMHTSQGSLFEFGLIWINKLCGS